MMKETVEIKTEEERTRIPKTKPKKRKVNKWGVYISILLIALGVVWYATNMGYIPIEFLRQQAGPILAILIGILILIKSL